MKRLSTTPALSAAAQAVERVLRAERDAEVRLEQVQQQAQDQLEQARDEARAIVNRSMERIARWRQAHAAALESRLHDERDRAVAAARTQRGPDPAALTRAAEEVARLLTEAPGDRSS